MSPSTIFTLMMIGLLAGMVSGFFGVGGGIIMVPALVFIMGLSQHQAQGTSLAVMVLPVVLLGAINYYKAGYINIRFAIFVIIAFVAGVYLGSLASISLPDATLRKAFGVLMIIAGIKMILQK